MQRNPTADDMGGGCEDVAAAIRNDVAAMFAQPSQFVRIRIGELLFNFVQWIAGQRRVEPLAEAAKKPPQETADITASGNGREHVDLAKLLCRGERLKNSQRKSRAANTAAGEREADAGVGEMICFWPGYFCASPAILDQIFFRIFELFRI